MLKGIHLTLMIGPAVPLPVPQVVMDSLASVQVNNDIERSGFQLTFTLSKNSPLLTSMLPAGYFDPIITRIILVVTMNGTPTVLMDGMITRQELAPSNDPGQSTLTVTGEDLSVLMDVVQIKRPFPSMPVIAQIYLALAPYAAFGVIPAAVPPLISFTKDISSGWSTQTSTDREFLQSLARDSGYVFFVEPGPIPGTSVAYFGPDIRLPIPQPALNINMDAHTNVESLSFSLDGLAKKMIVVFVQDPITKKIPIPVPVPNISILRPPLGARLTPPSKIEFPEGFSKLSLAEAANHVLGILAQSADAVSASGSLDVLRYGHILKSRQLVGVRGAGRAYDGMYYVQSVTHNIKRGEYKQNFTLSRDGLISQTSTVMV